MTTLTKTQSLADRKVASRKMAGVLNTDQQIKYLHLQAEVEVLLQRQQSLKVRRQLEALVR
ncbi:MAG: hypothetical protein AAGG51_12990 [Cyanobacteria bacterium P01_G01_bin.54]